MLRRFGWFGIVAAICLPVAVLATGVQLPYLDGPAGAPRPADVPDGDTEMAWLHTSTNGTTWERFVSGVVRAQSPDCGLTVDDTHAFSESTTGVPEVVVSRADRPGKLRIRWYKLTTDATTAHWVAALASRSPAPVALIGGGSSDRAADLAHALDARTDWRGVRPLLFMTTATADELSAADGSDATTRLIDVYDDRSFRFCFTNRQMAEAVVDFVLRGRGRRADTGGVGPPLVLSAVWLDDPFSTDLHARFLAALGPTAKPRTWEIPFSVGGFNLPNAYEMLAADGILAAARADPARPVLLVLPTVTQPARRLLRALIQAEPGLRDRLTVATGDGISVNALYRDGAFTWPVHALPVPLVLFTHSDPVAWDTPGGPAVPLGYELRPPNSTEEVRLFTEMTRVMCGAAFADPAGFPDAPELARRLHATTPPFFDDSGERRAGEGEHVVLLKPSAAGAPAEALLEVYRRSDGGGWRRVNSFPIDQRRRLPAGPPEPPRD
jgi:hypothetical protein